jgi:hypothetical protein
MAQDPITYVDKPMTPAQIAQIEQIPVTWTDTDTNADPYATPSKGPEGLVGRFATQFSENMQPLVGVAKGAAGSVYGAAKLVHDYMPGAFDESDPEALKATNTAQAIGKGAEQMAEFALPTPGAKGRLAKLGLGMLRDAGVTMMQTGSPTTGAVAAGLTGVVGGVTGAVGKFASTLERSAMKSEGRALGVTQKWAKDKVERELAPGMLDRGVSGTRPQMLAEAKAASKAVEGQLDTAYAQAAKEGVTIPSKSVIGDIQIAKVGLMTRDRTGQLIPIEGSQKVINRLDRLENFVRQLPDDIPADQARKVKGMWDRIVNKGGLYGANAGASATDKAAEWAFREGTGSFRELMAAKMPDVAALNKEYTFWRGMKDVLKETQTNTIGQTGGLGAMIGGSAGAAAGYGSSDSAYGGLTGAFVGATGARNLVRLMQSPYWHSSVSAPLKAQMARALASGSRGEATGVISRMLASLPAQARNAFKE